MSDNSERQRIAANLLAAEERLQASLQTARQLLEAGFPGPSFVWSVRSVEMFLKFFVLAPLACPRDGDRSDWDSAVKKASKDFGNSNWDRAMEKVEAACGPLDPMRMEDGGDAYTYWRKKPVRYRGSVVHGQQDGTREAAEAVLAFAEQMIRQLKLRLLVAGTHPFHDVLTAELRRAWERRGNS